MDSAAKDSGQPVPGLEGLEYSIHLIVKNSEQAGSWNPDDETV